MGSGSAAGALISLTSHVGCRSDGGNNERVVYLRCANKEDTIVLFSGWESNARYSFLAENQMAGDRLCASWSNFEAGQV